MVSESWLAAWAFAAFFVDPFCKVRTLGDIVLRKPNTTEDEKKIICIWKPGGLQKGQSIAITATGHGVFYRFCLPKNLVGYLSFFMNLMLLYTLYQIEMNLRKPGDVYRFVTAHIWANKRPPMKSCKVCEWERKRVKNAHSPENESLHQIFTMKRRLFI